jgi:hypothetical protein
MNYRGLLHEPLTGFLDASGGSGQQFKARRCQALQVK